jgi:hypothetical protein
MDADFIYALPFSLQLGRECKGKQQQRGFGSTSCARTGTIDFPIYGGRCSISREIESSLSSYLRPPRRFGPADRNSSINTIREVGCSATEMAA